MPRAAVVPAAQVLAAVLEAARKVGRSNLDLCMLWWGTDWHKE